VEWQKISIPVANPIPLYIKHLSADIIAVTVTTGVCLLCAFHDRVIKMGDQFSIFVG